MRLDIFFRAPFNADSKTALRAISEGVKRRFDGKDISHDITENLRIRAV